MKEIKDRGLSSAEPAGLVGGGVEVPDAAPTPFDMSDAEHDAEARLTANHGDAVPLAMQGTVRRSVTWGQVEEALRNRGWHPSEGAPSLWRHHQHGGEVLVRPGSECAKAPAEVLEDAVRFLAAVDRCSPGEALARVAALGGGRRAAEFSDLVIVSMALGIAIATADEAFEEWCDDDEDRGVWEYVKRVGKAVTAGDLGPIRDEIAADDAEEAAQQARRVS